MKKSNIYAVIMAGGKGERFWPLSRESRPKQFLDVFTGESMLVSTVKRIADLVPPKNTIVVTSRSHENLVKKVLKGKKGVQVLSEPVGKNTAPAIAAAATLIERENPRGIMLVLSADHLIEPAEAFVRSLKLASKMAERPGALICLGVTPRHPHTGLGHIEQGSKTHEFNRVDGYRIARFIEKPPMDDAVKFTQSGKYLWNCGIFAWSVSTILRALMVNMRDLYVALEPARNARSRAALKKALDKFYKNTPAESIDYGVLEKEKRTNLFVVKSPMNWRDVGSWTAFKDLFPADLSGNLMKGSTVDLDSRNCMVLSNKGLTATCGLYDVFVVRDGDSVLVIHKDKVPEMKKLVAKIRESSHKKQLI